MELGLWKTPFIVEKHTTELIMLLEVISHQTIFLQQDKRCSEEENEAKRWTWRGRQHTTLSLKLEEQWNMWHLDLHSYPASHHHRHPHILFPTSCFIHHHHPKTTDHRGNVQRTTPASRTTSFSSCFLSILKSKGSISHSQQLSSSS